MENYNEKKDNKRPFVKDEGQKFYFDEEGKLVVESNKGVWVDGEPRVKMYGNFTCNAKTLGIIINKFKGFPVVISNARRVDYFSMGNLYDRVPVSETSAIVNPTEEDKGLLEKIEMYNIRNENMNVQINDLKEQLLSKNNTLADYVNAVERFNNLPWWKRVFKKVEI